MHARSFLKLAAVRAAFSLVLALAATAAVTTASARTHESFSMEVLVDGAPLEEYAARSRTYVEAQEGREYAIRLTNHTGRRVAVALSVDGLNTIDAKTTTARQASKWILGPWETVTLSGWQVGQESARRFFFTTEENSYGEWLGKTSNLGVITAAVFRERRHDPAPVYRRLDQKNEAQGAPAEAEAGGESRARPEPSATSKKADADDLAATGIGRKFDHRVHRVHFEAEPSPQTVTEIRYEYRDALIRLGALPPTPPYWEDALERRESARGFEDLEFAPDPYR
jgi:hypothetical protein